MKKKVFLQLRPIHLFFENILYIIMLIAGSWCIIHGFCSKEKIDFDYILCIIGFLFWGFVFYLANRHRIVFTNDYICCPKSFGRKKNCFQHKAIIKYEDIIDVYFICSSKNSRNRTTMDAYPVFRHYIVFKLKNKRQQRININQFSKKQKIKIFNEVQKRMIAHGNIVELKDPKEMIDNLEVSGSGLFVILAERSRLKKKNKSTERNNNDK